MSAGPLQLPPAQWLSEPSLVRVIDALNGGGIETRIVGGAVRDAILGNPHGDVDLATTADTDTVQARAAEAGLKAVPTGVEHGTVTIVSGGRPYEVTTLRHDVETHGRRATVAFGASWEEDARRRDFTINALYADLDGRIHDPVGGYPDVLAGRVRFIGDAGERIREDYLRILRFFRFHAQFGRGAPNPEGLQAVIRGRRGLAGLSGERVRQEMLRLLAAPGAVETVVAMADCGILGDVTGGVPYTGPLARVAAVEAASGEAPDAILRLAALSVCIPEDGERLGQRLRLSNAERRRLTDASEGWWHVSTELGALARRTLLYRLGAATYRDRVTLAFARSGADPADRDWRALRDLADAWPVPVFPLRGADLVAMGVPRGPAVGRLMGELEAAWIAGGFAGDRDTLLARARRAAEGGPH